MVRHNYLDIDTREEGKYSFFFLSIMCFDYFCISLRMYLRDMCATDHLSVIKDYCMPVISIADALHVVMTLGKLSCLVLNNNND